MQQTEQGVAQRTLSLRRFQIKDMPDNSTCVLVAMSSGGKTTLGLDLLWYKRHLPAWYLFSESEGCSGRLSQTIPPLYTFPNINLKKLESIYNYQQRKIEKYTRPRTEAERRIIPDDELPMSERFFKNPCVGGYFEDCFGDKKVFNQKAVQNLLKNGRHRCMFSIIPCQYIMDFPSACRKQVKYWFLFKEDSKDVRKKLYDQVGSICGCTFELFEQIMTYCTENYGCVVIDNMSKSNKLEDRVFWYRAEYNRPAFKVGCRNYWEFSKKNLLKTADVCTPEEEEAMRKLEAARMAKKMGVTKHHTVLPTITGKANPMSLLNTASMLTAAQTGFQHMSKGRAGNEPFKIELV